MSSAFRVACLMPALVGYMAYASAQSHDCPSCPDMVAIPAGSFEMGQAIGNPIFRDQEPVHRVTIASFAMSRTEITRGQFAAFVAETNYDAGDKCWTFDGWTAQDRYYREQSGRNWRNPGFVQDDNHPVVCVAWQDAKAYVEWLTRKTGKRYRLPSEAEWEYSARAGSTTSRPWGDNANDACNYANVWDLTGKSEISGVTREPHRCSDKYAFTAPVGSFKPNAFGLYDMIGNAWEWVEDCWHNDYKGAPNDGSAWAENTCQLRLPRGGAWLDFPGIVYSATRGRKFGLPRNDSIGFRVARD